MHKLKRFFVFQMSISTHFLVVCLFFFRCALAPCFCYWPRCAAKSVFSQVRAPKMNILNAKKPFFIT